jgi:hypothetical protein
LRLRPRRLRRGGSRRGDRGRRRRGGGERHRALNLVETLDVQHVVLTGTDFARHERAYLDAVAATIERHRPRSSWRSVTVTAAAHGEDSVAAGAGAQVLQRFVFDLG